MQWKQRIPAGRCGGGRPAASGNGALRVSRRFPAGTALALFLLMLAASSPVQADFPGDVPDRFKIQLGGVAANFDTAASLSLTDGPIGAFVNFEDVFDLPVSKSSWSVEGFWRFSDKGYMDFGYVDFRREAGTVLEQDVNWGDVTIETDALVKAKFSTSFPYAAYRHDFLQLEQVRISFSAGVSYLRLGAGVAADGGIVDSEGDRIVGHYEKDADLSFPVPLLGLQLDWRLTRHTALQLYNRFLYISTRKLRGGLDQTAVRYEWWASRQFAVGGGVNTYRISIRRYETGDYTARFEYNVVGLEGFLKFAY